MPLINHTIMKKKITFILSMSLLLIYCHDISTPNKDLNTQDFSTPKNNVNKANSDSNLLDISEIVRLEYGQPKQVSIFQPDDQRNKILTIVLEDTTIVKELDNKLNIQNLDTKNEQILLSNCQNTLVGKAYGSQFDLGQYTIEICENSSGGTWSSITYAIGENMIYSVSYTQNSVNFPTASFSTEWQNNTHWYYNTIYNGQPHFDLSFIPNTQTTFSVGNQTIGSDVASLNSLRINKTIIGSIPTTPLLTSPNNSSDISLPESLNWEESQGNPPPDYELNIFDNSSFNYTTTIDNTAFNNTTFNLTHSLGLEHNKTYYWRVRASNSTGSSSWSTTRSFTFIDIPQLSLISGPSEGPLEDGTTTYSINVEGGAPPYEYEWERRHICASNHNSYCLPGEGNWILDVLQPWGDTFSFNRSAAIRHLYIRVTVTDSNNYSTTSYTHYTLFWY